MDTIDKDVFKEARKELLEPPSYPGHGTRPTHVDYPSTVKAQGALMDVQDRLYELRHGVEAQTEKLETIVDNLMGSIPSPDELPDEVSRAVGRVGALNDAVTELYRLHAYQAALITALAKL